MRKEGNIVQYTADELAEMRRRGEGRTDFDAVRAMTDEELEASIDYEDEGHFDWSTFGTKLPESFELATIYYDADVIEWFKAQGPGYEDRINDVLRNYIREQEKKTA